MNKEGQSDVSPMNVNDGDARSSGSIAPQKYRPSATALFRQKANTEGFLVPNEDPVQVLCNSLQFSTNSTFDTIRRQWRCANIATLATNVKYWLDDDIDLSKCSSCELQAFMQKSLSTMEFEYEFTLPVITMVVIVWLTDINQKNHIRRSLVVSSLQAWFVNPSNCATSQDIESMCRSTGSVDYYTSPGYSLLMSDAWESSWTDIFSVIMHHLMKNEEYTLDVNTLRVDWLKVYQRGRSLAIYISEEKEKFEKYADALVRLSISLPSDYDRVVNLVRKADQSARKFISKHIRDKRLAVHKLSYESCRQLLLQHHRSSTLLLPWEDKKDRGPKGDPIDQTHSSSTVSAMADKVTTEDHPDDNPHKGKPAKKTDATKSSRSPCKWCHKRSHTEDACWYNPINMGGAPAGSSTSTSHLPSSSTSSPQPQSTAVTTTTSSMTGLPPKPSSISSPSLRPEMRESSSSPSSSTSQPAPAPKKAGKSQKPAEKSSGTQDGPITRSQTGKLPSPTATTFAVGHASTSSLHSASLMSIDIQLSSTEANYECIIDTASVHTLIGPQILQLPNVKSSPCNGQVSVFNGQSISFSHEVIIPARFPGIDIHFNVKAYVCASTSMLSNSQLLLGIGTLTRMKAEIDVANGRLHIGALEVTVPSRATSSTPVASVLSLTTSEVSSEASTLSNHVSDDIATRFEDFTIPIADYHFKHHHPVLRPKRWNTGTRQKICSDLLDDLQSQGVVTEVNPDDTMHFAQALAVPKKCSAQPTEYRLVVDFRAINQRLAINQPTRDLLPYVDSPKTLLQSIPSSSRFYSCLDISSAYHCVPLSERARLCTGVTDGKRYFLYNRLAQGHKYSSYWWCYSLKCVLARAFGVDISQLSDCGVTVYVDDIVCFGDTIEQCQARVDFVTAVLQHLGWLTNDRKFQPPSTSIEVCGLRLVSGQWFLSDHHLQQVRQLRNQLPKTPHDLRSKLGILQFCRMLWYNPRRPEQSGTHHADHSLSALARPFNDLLTDYTSRNLGNSKRVKLQWDEALQRRWELIFDHMQEEKLSLHCLGEPLGSDMIWVLTFDSSETAAAGSIFKSRRPHDLNDIDHDYLQGTESVLVDSWSECYHGSSIRWPIHDREAYSLVRTLERYKYLLISTIPPIDDASVNDSAHFVVLGDNSVTISNFQQLNFPADGLRGRRWISWYERIWPLSEYKVHYKHIAGETNFLSDAFSRIISDLVPIPSSDLVFAVVGGETIPDNSDVGFDDQDNYDHDEDLPALREVLRRSSPTRLRLAELQKNDTSTLYCGATLASIYDEVQQLDATEGYDTNAEFRSPARAVAQSGRFIMDSDGLLLTKVTYDGQEHIVPVIPDGGDFRDCLVLPYIIDNTTDVVPDPQQALTAKQFFVWLFHDGPIHIGRSRTYTMARRNIWFPSISTYIRNYVRRCPTCAPTSLHHHPPTPLKTVPLVTTRFKHLAIDHVDPRRPNVGQLTVILSIVDLSTNWVCFVPVKDHSALVAAEAIYTHWIANFGWPASIQSDNHQAFCSKLWEALGLLCGLRLPRSTAYYPPGNGAIERKNRDLRSLLNKFEGYDRWDLLCKLGQMVLNTSTASEHDLSPSSLVLGTKDISPTPIHLFVPNITSADSGDMSTITSTDQYLHLQQLRQQVAESIDTWLQESILLRTDERIKEVDRRNCSSPSSNSSPLSTGQRVFFKPNGPSVHLRRGTIARCLNPSTGVYDVMFDDEPNKSSSINGRLLIPFDELDQREHVLRFFSNPDVEYTKDDILAVNFADDSTRFYFAEFKDRDSDGHLKLQPLQLQGARLMPLSTILLASPDQVNYDVPPFRLQGRRLIPRAVLQRLVTLGFNLQQAN
ncbi:gag/pol/env polyprotein, putative [Perkinsus marinus ATCC 50983]|uniref:Gag/pol/env polyprotein, putative n=1 Tax=Perkinsus marinus (strain ATCC 50983 / TXsc) TaxID=423536 RepID=C5KGP9_PERM5|nr:gag/pol/env polyprotein, putative [Perkinsus marinus ATCC 50983]EER16317.1 gag/pol/env polyprotein, putative [Perkinsus marinus ATCC 50983]|eukprot:XP_002784521.1 gag/pol/env polyprotein, putative [Perkinsus marinus ATCC 50983]